MIIEFMEIWRTDLGTSDNKNWEQIQHTLERVSKKFTFTQSVIAEISALVQDKGGEELEDDLLEEMARAVVGLTP